MGGEIGDVLKQSTQMASALAADKKIAVSKGARIDADGAVTSNEHIILNGVKVDGKSISNVPWFIHAAAWTSIAK